MEPVSPGASDQSEPVSAEGSRASSDDAPVSLLGLAQNNFTKILFCTERSSIFLHHVQVICSFFSLFSRAFLGLTLAATSPQLFLISFTFAVTDPNMISASFQAEAI